MNPSSTNCCAKGAGAATSPLPDPAPDAIDPPNNAAFVAVHTGFEIQIDEEARGDRRFGEPDGSFFARTGAIYKITSPGTGQGQQDYKNNQNLAPERWHSYEIEVNNQDYIVRLNGQVATRFRRSATDTVRGNPPSVYPNSGFIGLQTHTGNVAFANVRIKTQDRTVQLQLDGFPRPLSAPGNRGDEKRQVPARRHQSSS